MRRRRIIDMSMDINPNLVTAGQEVSEREYIGILSIYGKESIVKVKVLPLSITISRSLSYDEKEVKEPEKISYVNWTFGFEGRIRLVDILLNHEKEKPYEIVNVIDNHLSPRWTGAEAKCQPIPDEAKIVHHQIEISEFPKDYLSLIIAGHELADNIIKNRPIRKKINKKEEEKYLTKIMYDNDALTMLQKVANSEPRNKIKGKDAFTIQYYS